MNLWRLCQGFAARCADTAEWHKGVDERKKQNVVDGSAARRSSYQGPFLAREARDMAVQRRFARRRGMTHARAVRVAIPQVGVLDMLRPPLPVAGLGHEYGRDEKMRSGISAYCHCIRSRSDVLPVPRW